MKKILLLFFSIVLFSFGNAQSLKNIPQKVQHLKSEGKRFVHYDLFTQDVSKQKKEKYEKAATEITVLQLQKSVIQNIIKDQPEALEITFPYENTTLTIELIKHNIFSGNLSVNTDKGIVPYQPGVYYQGIVKGDNRSIAAFSFFDNDVIGTASILNVGNIVLGKVKSSEDFVAYNDATLIGENPFVCGADQLEENVKKKISFDPTTVTNSKKTDNCVRIYFEIGYGPYTQNGSNTTTTTNWITAMFNNIQTLYSNDDINVAMSDIFIWTSNDPYSGNPSQILNQFRNTRQTFNGDVAQLVRNPATTSIAYLDALCSNANHSYSGVNQSYQNVPTYSWNIEAMTHEIGHNLGSPHTHACAWNGNDTAIDGCGPASGNNEGCNAPLPTNGGTIMSYCHLVSSVGINLALGFGEQPAALIRNTVNSKGCLGTNCTASCDIKVSAINFSNLTKNSVTITIEDNVSTFWKYRIRKSDGTIVKDGTTTSKTFQVTNLEDGQYYEIMIGRTDCSGPQAFEKSILILTDANWCSKNFIDTGGITHNYDANQTIIKTFYPTNTGDMLKLFFTEFNIEPKDGNTIYDYMTIYNGSTVSSPVFSGGNQLTGNTIPGPFLATNPDGAITVKFVSDGGLELSGWNAYFECISLATNETDANESIQISPNPTRGLIEIASAEDLQLIEVIDISGKKIQVNPKIINTKKNSLDLSSFPKGTYLIKIKTTKQDYLKKIIKY